MREIYKNNIDSISKDRIYIALEWENNQVEILRFVPHYECDGRCWKFIILYSDDPHYNKDWNLGTEIEYACANIKDAIELKLENNKILIVEFDDFKSFIDVIPHFLEYKKNDWSHLGTSTLDLIQMKYHFLTCFHPGECCKRDWEIKKEIEDELDRRQADWKVGYELQFLLGDKNAAQYFGKANNENSESNINGSG